jgi:mannose/cellobiose epimerase-like protein (N-acyl-D-glucosamine 2-epimerase family)
MTSIDPAAVAGAAAVRRHFDGIVLPHWHGAGFNAELNLPFEALAPQEGSDPAALPVARYRAMACARQLYVFTMADVDAAAAHARRLFDALQAVFRNPRHGGWLYSVDAHGAPLDSTQDLYTHAFVVYACAAYARRFDSAPARELVWQASATIEQAFARADGLYHSALDESLARPLGGPLQNPIMHLTEAYLAAHALFDGQDAERARGYVQRLRKLAAAVTATFVVPDNACIAEKPVGEPDNRIEPGHQFEWFSLVAMAPGVFAGTALPESTVRAYGYACRHGVSATTAGVCAALTLAGEMLDPAERIWAQTEYLRALALDKQWPTLARTLAQFQSRFLHGGGWTEVIAADGGRLRHDMPSTTPYHLSTAYQALP